MNSASMKNKWCLSQEINLRTHYIDYANINKMLGQIMHAKDIQHLRPIQHTMHTCLEFLYKKKKQ